MVHCRQTANCHYPYVYGIDNKECIYPCQKDGEDADNTNSAATRFIQNYMNPAP
jgi:hypothetical protein